MKGRIATAVLTALVVAPAGLRAQGSFEGVITMSGSMAGQPPMQTTYYQKGTKTRTESAMGGQQGISIFDAATGQSMMIIPAMRQYMVVNVNDMMKQMPAGAQRPPDFSKMKATPTGKRETIAGIPCEHYIFTEPGPPPTNLDVCGAAGMGFMGGGRGVGGLPSTANMLKSTNPQMAALAKRGFFPLKTTIKMPEGGSMVWQVTKIQRQPVAASMFAPPAGYTKMNMPAMPGMGGMPKR